MAESGIESYQTLEDNFFMKQCFKKITLLCVSIMLTFGLASCSFLEDFIDPETQNSTQAPVLEPTKFKILLINTPQIRFYDFASFRYLKSGKKLSIDLYTQGKIIKQITITQQEICMGKECLPMWIAAKKFFGPVSYPNLFGDILRAKDIFDGEGKRVSNDGAFVQWFVKGGQEIYYERARNRVLFKNLTANITIGIEDYILPAPESK